MDDGSSGWHAVRGVRRDKSDGRDATGQRLAGDATGSPLVFLLVNEGVDSCLPFAIFIDVMTSLCRCFNPLCALSATLLSLDSQC